MKEWFEDESFWIQMYPFMFPRKRFEEAEEQIDKILRLIDFHGSSILDLCCGPGRHAVILAKRGLNVTGVDRTPFLLEKAREIGRAQNVQIEWILEDMRNFIRQDSYDLVLNMFTSFGYFDSKEDDVRILQNIYQSLKPGGACLIDVIGKELLAKVFQTAASEEMPDGTILVQRREIFDDWSRIRNEWILIKEGEAKSFKFHHTIYSGQELKDRLMQVGFQRVNIFGGLEGMEYGPNAKRLIAVAWKSV